MPKSGPKHLRSGRQIESPSSGTTVGLFVDADMVQEAMTGLFVPTIDVLARVRIVANAFGPVKRCYAYSRRFPKDLPTRLGKLGYIMRLGGIQGELTRDLLTAFHSDFNIRTFLVAAPPEDLVPVANRLIADGCNIVAIGSEHSINDQFSSVAHAFVALEHIATANDLFEATRPAWSAVRNRESARNHSPVNFRVFLCHASGDKPSVRALYRRLRDDGFLPWLDEESLLAGQDWDREIAGAVRTSGVVLVCLSRTSVTKEGFVQKEIKYALDVADEKPEGTIFIIPVRLEECEVPSRLRRWQWVNLYEESGYVRLWQALRARQQSLAGPG